MSYEPDSEGFEGPSIPGNLGTLVINVWREPEHEQELRARLSTLSLVGSEAKTTYAADLETVLAQVTEWFQSLAEGRSPV